MITSMAKCAIDDSLDAKGLQFRNRRAASSWTQVQHDGASDFRFGSKADMCSAVGHVRFTPNSDRESGLPAKLMSALPPKADMCSAEAHVCFGPIADSCIAAKGLLFDHLVGPQQKRRRNGYPQRVSSSHVDHRFEFRRPFDRQFTRIGPSRDLTSKDTYQPIQAE